MQRLHHEPNDNDVGMGWEELNEALLDVQAMPERGYPLAAGEWAWREVAVGHLETFHEARDQQQARDVVLTNQDAHWERPADRYSYQLFELTDDGQYVHIHDGTVPGYFPPAPAGYALYRSERGATLALEHNQETGLLHILVYNTRGNRAGAVAYGRPEDGWATQHEFSAFALGHGPDVHQQRGLRVLVHRLY